MSMMGFQKTKFGWGWVGGVSSIQSITFEASDRSRFLPLALIHFLASELSLAPIRKIAGYKLFLS